jgi:hypothetical protein
MGKVRSLIPNLIPEPQLEEGHTVGFYPAGGATP